MTATFNTTDEVNQNTSYKSSPSSPSILILQHADMNLGPEIGRGGFCTVREIRQLKSALFIANKRIDTPTASQQPYQNGLKYYDTTLKTPLLNSSPITTLQTPPYVAKMLRTDLTTHAQSRAKLDLCIEATHLLTLSHKHIIKLVGISRGVAAYFQKSRTWKQESEFFILLERLDGTLDNKMREWKEEIRELSGKKSNCRREAEDGVLLSCLPGWDWRWCFVWRRMRRKRKMKHLWIKRLIVARDVARAIKYLHDHGVIYRDLKPSNVGFTSHCNQSTILFDFGLAKKLRPNEKQSNNTYRMTGHTGSLRYMAPEVALDLPYNTTVDSYSFAMVLWQICSLETPFLGFSREKHSEVVIGRGYRPELGRNWPKGCKFIIERCWDENLEVRLDFGEILEVLESEIEIIGKRDDYHLMMD